jgi:glycosyltransferase involved in cell wall biosynthesis
MFWQAIAARKRARCKCKIVCTIKNNTYTSYPGVLGRVKLALARKGISAVDFFLASSENVARLYHEQFAVPRDKMAACYHLGVDTDLFRPAAKSTGRGNGNKLVVGYCGRFDEDKGVLDLIEAVGNCRRDQGADLDLHLLGNGLLREKILRIKEENPWMQVFDPVPHAEVPRFLQGLDIFTLPSRVSPAHEEHDAHALVEALSVGLPCVGTRSGIIPELLGRGAGLLAPANSSDGLAGAIARLAGDASLRDSLGRQGRAQMLEEHAIDALAKKKAGIFNRLGCN